jgi:RecG-like helicase
MAGAAGRENGLADRQPQEKRKEAANVLIASGEAQLVIGTHALIQDNVQFKNWD